MGDHSKRDPEQHALEERLRYQRMTPTERSARNTQNYAAAQARITENRKYVRSFACSSCGSKTRTEWHHPNGDGIPANRLAYLCSHSRSYLNQALAKCVPLCLNCHRREHAILRRKAGFRPKRIRTDSQRELAHV